MIFGTVEEVRRGRLSANKKSFAITDATHLFVVRPFRAIGIGLALGLLAFTLGCFDLLYVHELALMAVAIMVCVLMGETTAHLAIVNRDLPGSDLSIALWGSIGALNALRRRIVEANPKASTDGTAQDIAP